MNPFAGAALRLTLWYLALIMAVSIACSLALYHVSSNDLRRAVLRQINFYSEVLAPEEFASFSRLRQAQLNADIGNLKERLAIFNLTVLIGGGLASYALARKTMRPLEESYLAQSRFSSDASHELRTPLSVMQTEIEVALRNPKLSPKAAKDLMRSNLEELGRLKNLAEGLLQLTDNSAEALPLSSVSVEAVVTEAVERTHKANRGQKLHIKLDGQGASVMANQKKLVDLVIILLDNAVKYSPPASPISITTGNQDRRGFIRVTDKGQGISATDLPRIFERFYRTDNSRTKNRIPGYGLGLAIAKQIARAHHGSIEVKSTLGKGSSFTVYIPKAKSQSR